MKIDDRKLIAYVDGELDAAGRAEVEAAIAADPVLGVRLDEHRLLRGKVAGAYARVADESVPARLMAAAQAGAKANADKRVAVIYYNHPPGRQNIGADNLDVPASLFDLLHALKAAGYTVGELPASPEALLDRIMAHGVNLPEDRAALKELGAAVDGVPAADYARWFATLPWQYPAAAVKELARLFRRENQKSRSVKRVRPGGKDGDLKFRI